MYETQSGDMFDLIAFKNFDDCRFTEDLMLANRNLLLNFIFRAGEILNLPTIEKKSKVKTPPWKSA